MISPLLLTLLENASRRGEEADQEKLNVLAEALTALMASRATEERGLEDAVTKLPQAVGLEERH